MLTLPIKKKWFDMILQGEKKEEYREYKQYYTTRFNNILNNPSQKGTVFYVIFKNGYSKNAPKIKCQVDLFLAETRHDIQVEWGAKPDKLYYILKILSVEEVK